MLTFQPARKLKTVHFTVTVFALFQCMASICLSDDTEAPAQTPPPDTSPAPNELEPEPTPDESAPEPNPSSLEEASPMSPSEAPEPAPRETPFEPANGVQASPAPIIGYEQASIRPGQVRGGFALEIHMGITKPVIAAEEEFLDFNTIEGGLFLGGKIGKVVVGLGLELSRIKTRDSDGDNYNYTGEGAMTSFIVKPGVRFVMFQSKDKKVDLYGQIDFGMGTMLFKDDYDEYADEDEKYLLIGWDTGPGVRYWLHPRFAFSAMGGIRGQYTRSSYPDSNDHYSYHLISIFGMIQILGVFGR